MKKYDLVHVLYFGHKHNYLKDLFYMKGKVLQFNGSPSGNLTSDIFETTSEFENQDIYMGSERRNERRRVRKSERVEMMIKNFGLERRMRTERRKEGTSWLLTSKNVVNQ